MPAHHDLLRSLRSLHAVNENTLKKLRSHSLLFVKSLRQSEEP